MGHAEPTATWSEFLADPDVHAARIREGGYEVLTVGGRREYVLTYAVMLDRFTAESDQAEFDQEGYEMAVREGLADLASERTRSLAEIEAEWAVKRGV